MPAVFISYSRKDFYFAESLAFHLAERGIANWLDANHLAPGREWSEEIDRALDEAQTVVVVVTPASVRSEVRAPRMEARAGAGRSFDSGALPLLQTPAGIAARARRGFPRSV